MASLGYVKNLRRWRVRWRATNRKTHYVFSGSKVFIEKAQAVGFYAEIEKQERLVRSGEVVPRESVSEVSLNFFRHIKCHTIRTQQHYRMVIEHFVESLPSGIIRIHQLEAAHIQEYLYRLRDIELKNRTLNAHLTAIKSFCRFYSERYKIGNPAVKIKLLTEDPPNSRFLTPDEYQKVLDIAPPLARNRIVFLAHTGLRATEFSHLTADCMGPQATTITISGKGRKKRTIPLNNSARAVLPELQTATKNALYLQFTRLAKKAKIAKFGPHALRHFFATQLLLKGKPIAIVSKLLGHASIKTTERCYSHILSDDLANATDVLDY